MEKRLIVIVAMPGGLAIDITGPADVFSCARQMVDSKCKDPFGVNYQLLIASPTCELNVTTDSGLVITCQTSIFDITEKIDTLIIGGNSRERQKFPDLIVWLKAHSASIKRVCSVCIGAFVLAEAGLLRNKNATTHWMHCTELSSRFEQIRVDPNSIFVKDGHIYTSAGASAGIDLSLALVEEDFGRDISLDIARTLVLYLRRPGNQSQFSNLLSQQFSSKKPVRELQQWIQTNLKANLNVQILAEKVSMSPRNFARVFFTETGFTPAKYIERLRVEFSKRYLEETNYSLDQIARECGFGSTDTMRNIFLRTIDTTPYDYRSLFGSN
jgi:transcriptional regulator GlxA family with amidase domain